jgi:hypothetical protein
MNKMTVVSLLLVLVVLQSNAIAPIEEGKTSSSLVGDKSNILHKLKKYSVSMNNAHWARVDLNGTEIISKDDSGQIIAKGIAGIDDSEVIRKTVDALDKGAIELVGTFKITTSIDNLKPNVWLKGFPGKTVFICSDLRQNVFSIGEENYGHSTIDLAASSSLGDTKIIVKDAKEFGMNDYIKLIDDEQIMDFKKGQIFKIEGIINNQLFLNKEIEDKYDTERNANIRKVIMCENITIEGIDFIGPGIGTKQQLLNGHLLKHFRFINNSVSLFGTSALSLSDSIDCTLLNNEFEEIFMDGMGYAIVLSNACENITIRDNRFTKKGRHYIAVGGDTGDYSYGGFARDINILNNYFQNSTSEAVNTHPPFKGPIRIAGNTFESCDKGISIFNGYSEIYDNNFFDCIIGIQVLSEYLDDDNDDERIYKIYSNIFKNNTYNMTIEINGNVITRSISEGCFRLTSHEMHYCDG